MAVNYQTIIDAIDQAILNWSGRSVRITQGDRTFEYRSFEELLAARKYYQKLLAGGRSGRGFKISGIRPGGAA